MDKIHILVVDDHAIVRTGLKSLLNANGEMEVVGEAGTGEEALEKARELRPQVVLMDIAMPGINGIEATRRLKLEMPDTNVLVLSMHDDEEFLFPVLKAGALGYVLKDTDPGQLLYAVRCAAQGQPFLSPAVARALLEGYMSIATREEGEKYGELSSREKQVLRLVAAGKTNREIAEKLFLSIRTVEKHRQAVMRKLSLTRREELIKYAIRRGLMDLETSIA